MRYSKIRGRTVCFRTPRRTVQPKFRSLQDLHRVVPAPSQNLSSKGAEVVACERNDYPTKAETVRNFAEKQESKNVKAGK